MNLDRSQICIVDCETVGLDADLHGIWEVGVIYWVVAILPGGGTRPQRETKRWFLPVDLSNADPMALRIGGFHERHPDGVHFNFPWSPTPVPKPQVTSLETFAKQFVALTDGKHLLGACISFDEKRLEKLLRANGQRETYHYHSLDIEAMAYGFLSLLDTVDIPLPFKSADLSDWLGVDKDEFAEHTALGDCEWVEAQLIAMETIAEGRDCKIDIAS